MRMITRKKPAFTELYQTGVLTRIAAVKSPDGGGWRLFGLWRDKEIAVFVEAARGGVREGANKQVISSQADSLIKISRIWADFFPANTS
ncbi:MAG: hypothetical protein E7B34_11980, partial [Hafnia alvei]|nr:hypothetical protein [Hafnia alvei]